MKSYFKTLSFGKFLKKSKFSSILKNKDQSSEDKSYSGTDSKHLYGSDRVNVDHARKGLTTPVDDTLTHQKTKKISKEETEKEVNKKENEDKNVDK